MPLKNDDKIPRSTWILVGIFSVCCSVALMFMNYYSLQPLAEGTVGMVISGIIGLALGPIIVFVALFF